MAAAREQEDAEGTRYTTFAWSPVDVQAVAPGMSMQGAVDWLTNNHLRIKDRLNQLSADLIETLVWEGVAEPDCHEVTETPTTSSIASASTAP